jgi:hypothetical protein
MFFIIFILTSVSPSVSPGKDATAVHFVDLPFAYVFAAVAPCVAAFTVDVII